MTLLLDYARDEVGLPMRGLQLGRHIGWTVDKAKAEAMSAAGARVVYYRAHERLFHGWEVSFGVGAERIAVTRE